MKFQKKNLDIISMNKAYSRDASSYRGSAAAVAHPESVERVCEIVRTTKHIVIRGGGSGLSGGAVPIAGRDTVVSLSKLNTINNLDLERKTVEVESGVILQDLQDYLDVHGLEFAVDVGSREIATLGGMIATNAASSRVGKLGRVSRWIRWLDVVDCHGRISRKGTTEISDYSGMEGITGVVIRACLRVVPKMKRSASIVPITNLAEMIEAIENLKRDSSISMIDYCDSIISEGIGLSKKPHLFVEYEGDSGKLKGLEYEAFLEKLDLIYPFVLGDRCIAVIDSKIMLGKFISAMKWFNEKRLLVFGHLSVGALYVCFREEQRRDIPAMMKFVKRLGGAVTFSHGIGALKRDFVEFNDRKILENVKKRTDPLRKFNVGKVI